MEEFRLGVKRARDASFGDGQGARTHSSVSHWIRLLTCLRLTPFRPLDPMSPLSAKLSELDVCDLYAWWLVQHQRVNHETAKGYLGIVNAWHDRETGIGLAAGMKLTRVYRMLDGYARASGVPPARIQRLGVRPRDLCAGIDAVFSPSSAGDVNRASLLVVALVAVLRAGDGVTVSSRRRFCPSVSTTRADVQFFPDERSPTHVRFMAVNCKARGVEAKRKLPRYLPMDGEFLSPGRMLWHLMFVVDPVPPDQLASTPLFRDPLSGKALSIDTMRSDVRLVMDAVGRDGSCYGAHSCRIGGATAMNFEHAPPETIKAAGVWSSDAYLAYLRSCGQDVLSVARAICSSRVDDLATDFLDVDAADQLDDEDFE